MLRERGALVAVGRCRPEDESLSSRYEIIGAVALSDSIATPAGMVTDWAMPLVAPEQLGPMTATTCSTLTSLVPASTAAFGLHCESPATSW